MQLFKKMIHKDALFYQPKGYNKNNRYLCQGYGTIINNSREIPLRIKCLDCNLEFNKI